MRKIIFILLFPITVFGQGLIFGMYSAAPETIDVASFGWYKPESYGAVGNGSTNDAAAFQAAIDAMPAAGGVLYCDAKNYRIAAKVTIDKPITLRGAGKYATILSTNSNSLELFDVTSAGAGIEDLFILNAASETTTAATAGYAVGLFDATRFRMKSVLIRGFYDQINMEAAAYSTYQDVHFLNFTHYGAYVKNTTEPDVGDVSFNQCYFIAEYLSGATAIRHESSGGLRIIDCKANWSGVSGTVRLNYFYDGLIGANTVDLIITGCSIENVNNRAIRLNTTGGATFSQIVITGNQIASYTSAIYMIDVQNVSGVSIKGNTMAYGVNGIYYENVTTIENDNVFWNNSGTEVTAGP